MPPFTYSYTPGSASQISALLNQAGQTQAQAVQNAANATAQGQVGAANSYSSALQNLAKLPSVYNAYQQQLAQNNANWLANLSPLSTANPSGGVGQILNAIPAMPTMDALTALSLGGTTGNVGTVLNSVPAYILGG